MKRKAPTRRDRPLDRLRDRPVDRLRDRPTKNPNTQKQAFFSPGRTSAFFPSATTNAFFQPTTTQPTTQATGSTSASTTPAPYYISFTHVAPPAQPDHSQLNPGPPGNASNRAGFTRLSYRPSLSIKWDHIPKPNAKGQIGLFAWSAKVGFDVHTLTIAISSQYASGSCPYRVTRAHEYRHARNFLRIFRNHRSTMVQKAQGIPLPTAQTPHYVAPAQVTATQNQLAAPLVQSIRAVKRQITSDMNTDRDSMDSPSSYAQEYAQCPMSEW